MTRCTGSAESACCAVPAEAGDGPGRDLGVVDHPRPAAARPAQVRHLPGTHQAMNAALGRVLTAFGYQVAPFGSGGAWLVTGRRSRGTEAGQ